MSLLLSLMTLALLTALGGAMVLGTITETAITANYREGAEAFYAAEAVVQYAAHELAAVSDWSEVLDGESTSGLADGAPAGTRRVGSVILDLETITQDVASAVGDDDSGPYRLYAYGRFADMLSGIRPSAHYVVAWVSEPGADDTVERETLRIVGRAYGPTGSRRSIVLAVARQRGSADTFQVTSWHELR